MKKYVAHLRIELEADDIDDALQQVEFLIEAASSTRGNLKHAVQLNRVDPAGFNVERDHWVQELGLDDPFERCRLHVTRVGPSGGTADGTRTRCVLRAGHGGACL